MNGGGRTKEKEQVHSEGRRERMKETSEKGKTTTTRSYAAREGEKRK